MLLPLQLAFFFRISVDLGRVIITLYALKLGAQPFIVGALAAMLATLPTLLAWQVGRIADRFGSRWVLLLGSVVGASGMLATYVTPSIPSLFVTATLYGILSAFSAVPVQNLVGLLSEPGQRAKNFSNLSLVVSTAAFAGPLLAGFSFDHAGPSLTCLGLSSMLLVPAALLLLWGGILPGGTRMSAPQNSVRALLSESGLWRVLTTSSLVVVGIDLFQVYIPIYGHGIGLTASAIGLILALYSLAAFVVRFFLTSLIDRLTAERVLAYSFLIGAAGFLLIPFFKGSVGLSLLSFFFGLGMGAGQPITMMMTFSSSNQGRSGEAMGLRMTANNLMRALGQVFFGAVSSSLGLLSVFCLNALLLASGWVFSRHRALGHRHKES